MNTTIQAIILAAGKSKRFNSEKTKLAYPICGQPMILFSTKLLSSLHISTIVVVGYQEELVKKIITQEHNETIRFVTQEQQIGTGHALACTKELWNKEHILVLNGDVPLITTDLLTSLYNEHIKSNATVSFVTTCSTDISTHSYGRVIKNNDTIAIVEAKDLQGNIEDYCCINAGIYLINKQFLHTYISELNTNNANKEFYITDLIKIASDNHLTVTIVKAPFDTVRGINTLQELVTVEHIKRSNIISFWMNNGVHFFMPSMTHIDVNVTIKPGTSIGSNVLLKGNSSIGKNCTIADFSIVEDSTLEDNVIIESHSIITKSHIGAKTKIGPLAHVHSYSSIKCESIIGNFVEIKNSVIGSQTKIKHLTYSGDAHIGSNVNIGAGTITCNYDGKNKHKTIINDNAFIGSNNTLIAPITIGNNAYTAAGSTLTDSVPDNALSIARSYQTTKENYAKKLKHEADITYQENEQHKFSFIAARVINHINSNDEQ